MNVLICDDDQQIVDLEKPTLRSMRDVESAANMFYYTED